MGNTTNYNLTTYDRITDSDALFIDFRDMLCGTGVTSNTSKIDTQMKANADAINLKANSSQVLTDVPAGALFTDTVSAGGTAAETAVVDTEGYFDSTEVEGALQEVGAQLEEITQYNGQADFVQMIANLKNYKSMVFKKLSGFNYSLFLHDGTRHASYKYVKDTNDDFIKIGSCFTGNMNTMIYDTADVVKVGGGWVEGGVTDYTTVVGAGFTGSIKGSELRLRYYADNRGGAWSIVVDGKTGTPFVFSTYAAVAGEDYIYFTDKSLSPNTIHSVVATFMGDDPLNVPSGGAGTSRGWILTPTLSTTTGTLIGYVELNAQSYAILSTTSNKEFAFGVSSDGFTNWLPEHESEGVAFNRIAPQFYIDGALKDVSIMADNEILRCDSFKLVQSVNCRLFGDTTDVAQIDITSTLDKRGFITIAGNFKALKNLTINAGYPGMIPAEGTVLDEVVTSVGNSKVSSADDVNYYFADEQDKCTSCAIVSATNSQLITAMSIDYPLKSLRQGMTGKNLATSLRFWQRSLVPKLYFSNYENGNMSTGETFIWHSRLSIGEIPDIYKYIK